jgi:subtilisin family serine protease
MAVTSEHRRHKMNSAGAAHEQEGAKAKIQVDLIADAYQEDGIVVRGATGPDGDLDFIYQDGVILVRDAYLRDVAAFLHQGEGARAERPSPAGVVPGAEGVLPGVSLYSLAGSDFPETLRALDAIDENFGVGVATPNHILSVTPVFACPATEPEEVLPHALPDPGECNGGGTGTFIYVTDTGLVKDADDHPWLAGVTGQADPPPNVPAAPIPVYTGHGTFVAGVARCMAPTAKVRVTRDFNKAGALSEHELVKRLRQALGQGPDVINVSAGGNTRKDLPLLGFVAFWDTYRHYKGTVLVASAGNNSSRRPFWPAAFPQVVGVGAIAANRRARAYFSDYGPWVDVYAPGEDLVNAYAHGTYICHEPPHIGQERHFDGMARWSGTSFSAPLVAGLIAARMSGTGENGRQAADALLARARAQRLPGVGPVLWPCDVGGCGCGQSCGCGQACGCRQPHGCGQGCGCRA